MILLASIIGIIIGITGTIISFAYNLPTSTTIVLVGASLFALSFILSPKNAFIKKGR